MDKNAIRELISDLMDDFRSRSKESNFYSHNLELNHQRKSDFHKGESHAYMNAIIKLHEILHKIGH